MTHMRRVRGELIDHKRVKQRLAQLKKDSYMTKSVVAGECNLAPSTITRMCEPGQRFDSDTIDIIEEVLEIRIRIPNTKEISKDSIQANKDNSPPPEWVQNSKFMKDLVGAEIQGLDIDLSRLKLILMQARDDPNFSKYILKLDKIVGEFTENLNQIKSDTVRSNAENEITKALSDISALESNTLSWRSLIILSAYHNSSPSELLRENSSAQNEVKGLEEKNLPQKQGLIGRLLRSLRKT